MPAATNPQTVSEEGKLPEERFADAGQLRDYCRSMIRADDKRTSLRARVESLFNGFPSYPRGKVTEGFGWFPRVNYRELEGLVSSQATPLYDLVTEVPRCIEVDLDIPHESEQQLQDWQDIFAKNVTWLLFKRCRQTFNYNILLQQREMLLHGLGYHVNVDKRWLPRTPRAGQIVFPEGCPLNFHEDGKVFLLRDFIPGEDVYGAIRNEGAARARGWNVDNVWKTLVKAQKQYQQGRTTGTESNQALEIQRHLRRGDIGYSNTSQVGFWMNWVYVKEYDERNGKSVSLYGIEENISATRKNAKDQGYLFKMRYTENDMPVTLFPFDIGNGEIDSVRGLGMRSKDFFELSNRMKNAMVAQVLISAFPQITQTIPNMDPDKLKLMRVGAFSVYPYGVKPELNQFPSLNNTGIALSKELRETLGENLASVQGGVPEPRDRETAYSFKMRANDQARVANGQLSLYESNLQHFYDRTVRLLLNTPSGNLPYQRLAKEFKDRCVRDGLPPESLKESAIIEVREVTSQGAGSAAARFQTYMTLFQTPVYQNAPEDKKIAIERALVASSLGQVNVDRFARSVSETDMPDQDDSLATVESSTLSQGGDALRGERQNDVKHASNHLQKAQQIAQQVQQGQMDPRQAATALQKLLDHAGQHLEKLQGNPQRQREFKQLSDQWEELAQFTQKLVRAVQQQDNQPNPEQSLNGDEARKDRATAADIHRKDVKADADIQRKARKDAVVEQLLDAKTAANIRRTSLLGR